MSQHKPDVGYPYAYINPVDSNSPLTVDRTTGSPVERSFCGTLLCTRSVYVFPGEPPGRVCMSCLKEFGGSRKPALAASRGFRPVTP